MFVSINSEALTTLKVTINFDDTPPKEVLLCDGDIVEIQYLKSRDSLEKVTGRISGFTVIGERSINGKTNTVITLDCSKQYQNKTVNIDLSNIRDINKI